MGYRPSTDIEWSRGGSARTGCRAPASPAVPIPLLCTPSSCNAGTVADTRRPQLQVDWTWAPSVARPRPDHPAQPAVVRGPDRDLRSTCAPAEELTRPTSRRRACASTQIDESWQRDTGSPTSCRSHRCSRDCCSTPSTRAGRNADMYAVATGLHPGRHGWTRIGCAPRCAPWCARSSAPPLAARVLPARRWSTSRCRSILADPVIAWRYRGFQRRRGERRGSRSSGCRVAECAAVGDLGTSSRRSRPR